MRLGLLTAGLFTRSDWVLVVGVPLLRTWKIRIGVFSDAEAAVVERGTADGIRWGWTWSYLRVPISSRSLFRGGTSQGTAADNGLLATGVRKEAELVWPSRSAGIDPAELSLRAGGVSSRSSAGRRGGCCK